MNSQDNELRFLYLAFDFVILNIAIALLYLFDPYLAGLGSHEKNLYVLMINMAQLFAFTLFSRRNLFLHDSFSNRVKRISKRVLAFFIILFAQAVLFLQNGFSMVFLLKTAFMFYAGMVAFYFFLYNYLTYRRQKGHYIHRVLILGPNEMGGILGQLMDSNPMLGYEFVGYITKSGETSDYENVLGSLDQLPNLVERHCVDYLFVTYAEYADMRRCNELLAVCNHLGIRLRLVPEYQYWFRQSMNHESVGSLIVFNPQEIPLDDIKNRFFKRAFDISFSLFVILFVMSWLYPLLYLVIKINSSGPVFFVQQRTGINNKTFQCLKFRSMTMSDDADSKQASKGDSRITTVGRFLRKSNLDEFPQFLNVLLGHMSIVGPRPHMLKHTEQYSGLIDYYNVRHYVKPGITGWAQVNGFRGETDELWKMEKRVEYDMNYLKNWNFWWDVKIVFLTLFGKKTYENAF